MRTRCALAPAKSPIIGPRAYSGPDQRNLACLIDLSCICMTSDTSIIGGRAAGDPPAQGLCVTGKLLSLRPTQFAVGIREVCEKRKKLEARATPRARWLSVVLGPGGEPYLHDGHHYAIALCRMGIKRAGLVIADDLSHLDPGTFWLTMARRSWARPIDGMGVHRPFEHMPASILSMEDDPFRSLAGALRRLGHYVKTSSPYTDFVWADFLRWRIARSHVDSDFEAAMDEAVRLIHTDVEAQQLPGWQGFAGVGAARSPPISAVPPPR